MREVVAWFDQHLKAPKTSTDFKMGRRRQRKIAAPAEPQVAQNAAHRALARAASVSSLARSSLGVLIHPSFQERPDGRAPENR